LSAEKLEEYMKDYEDMSSSHIKGEELRKEKDGARMAVKVPKTPKKA